MLDEDSGKPVHCPYCDSEGDCKHLLAVIDRTFLACSGGYGFNRFHEFRDKVEKAFLDKLRTGASSTSAWQDDLLDELWMYSEENYSNEDPDWLGIDGYILFRLIIELLEERGGYQYPGLIDDGGGPGFSSAITLFYATKPEDVFDKALGLLGKRLNHGE